MSVDLGSARLFVTHSALADLLSGRPTDSIPGLDDIARAVRRAASGLDLGTRHRHELRTAASHVSTYLHLLAPTKCDFAIAEGVVFWVTPRGRVADVLVLTAPAAPVVTAEVRGSARSLLADGAAAVRLCKLTAPLRSLLLTDQQSPPAELYGSEFWFGPASHSPEEIRTVLGGGL